MSFFFKISFLGTAAVLLMTIWLPVCLCAGDLDSPGLPDADASKSYTLQDLYNRLQTGATGTQSAFTEPGSGPTVGTMQNINTIMGVAPGVDDTDGAAAAHVLAGKKFWGLRSGAGWGLITGSLATQTPDPGTVSQSAGYYEAFDLSVVDTDLAAGNIRSGVSIFGVAGTAEGATGTAAAGDVLSGKTFSNAVSSGISGTMPNIGPQNITPGASSQTISQGYHDGTGSVAGDADLISDNIRSGVTIFSVSGNSNVVNTSSGTAASGDILAGKKAWVDGSEVIGTIATRTLSADSEIVQAGKYAGTTLSAVDSDLAAANIKKDVAIFGISGTFEGSGSAAGIPKTGQTLCWDGDGSEIPCPNTGQDGELQKGLAWPNPRFTDHGDGTVTDNLTNLMWVKEPGLLDGFSDARTWTDALKLFGVAVSNVAKWDGSVWSGAVDGLDGAVRTLSNDGSGLFAGGEL